MKPCSSAFAAYLSHHPIINIVQFSHSTGSNPSRRSCIKCLRRDIQTVRAGISITSNLRLGDKLPNLLLLVLGDLNLQCAHVLIIVLDPRGAGDGNNVVALGHQPRQGNLPHRTSLLLRNLVQLVHQLQILVEIFGREPRRVPPEVVLLKVIRRADTAREETPPERGIRNDGHAQLAARTQQLIVLNLERERRVLDLHGINVRDFARATKRLGATLAQAEILDLAGVLELLHLADGNLDRLVLVQPVAVVQVHVGQAQPTERLVDGAVDVLGLVADAELARVGVAVAGELGGEEDVLALAWVALEPLAQEFLTVAVYCIDEVSLLER